MTTVHYTRELDIDSSVVDAAYYDERTGELVVDLRDHLYLYKGVPEDVVDNLEDTYSAGSFYVRNIKSTYGPGEHLGLGYHANYNFVEVDVPAPDMSSVGTPKNLSYADNAVVTGNGNTGSSTGPHLSLTATEPKSFKVRVDFVVDNYREASHTLRVDSLDEAVTTVKELGSMLALTFDVKSVHFV